MEDFPHMKTNIFLQGNLFFRFSNITWYFPSFLVSLFPLLPLFFLTASGCPGGDKVDMCDFSPLSPHIENPPKVYMCVNFSQLFRKLPLTATRSDGWTEVARWTATGSEWKKRKKNRKESWENWNSSATVAVTVPLDGMGRTAPLPVGLQRCIQNMSATRLETWDISIRGFYWMSWWGNLYWVSLHLAHFLFTPCKS